LIILAILILRVRNVLHTGLMEAALERSVRAGGIGPIGDLQFCAHCELPLLEHAAFCNACGTAVRVQPKEAKPKIGAVLRTAGPDESIIPGFDTPLAGEEQAAPADQETIARREKTTVREEDTKADEARDRFYDEEEGRP
jgi:hypothetical protein